jgi:two-component system response regulator HydG
MQIDLLRVLDRKKIIRLGQTQEIDVDFRLISATRQNLKEKIMAGQFRNDFFYRINIISIEIPPLRDRVDDIPLLAYHFLAKYGREITKQIDTIDNTALDFLKNYYWPGNVRELENSIERAVVLSNSRTLTLDDFEFLKKDLSYMSTVKELTLRDMEKKYIEKILHDNKWNISRSANVLDISRATLHRMIKRYHMEKPWK